VTFAQLYQWLKASSWHGLRVLGHLAQNTPGTTQNSAVSPVLLTYTSPGLLACCRHNSRTSAGSMAQQGSMSKTLEGLQQLLQQPELDAVLGAAVRQQRLADVSFTLQELQATGLQAGGSSSSQLQYAATYGEDVGRLAYQDALQSSGALHAGWQQQQQPLSPVAARAGAAGITPPRVVTTSLVPVGSGQLQAAAQSHGFGSALGMPVSSPQGAPAAAAAAVTGAGFGYDAAAVPAAVHSISMTGLLQLLQSDPSLETSICIRQLRYSAACFEGVSLKAIPASLLLTNYIAAVGDRAQQCLSAGVVGQQDAEVGAECFALMQEVEGLLQLSGQPVLLQLLGGLRLQELVDGLTRCKQQLTERHLRWCKQLLLTNPYE
jgi:hypothetical protein